MCVTNDARAANSATIAQLSYLAGLFSVLFTVHNLQGSLDAHYEYRYEPYDLQSSRLVRSSLDVALLTTRR